MGMPLKRLVFLSALLLSTTIGMAQDVGLPVENVHEVPGHPGVYYFDLMKQVFPDAVANEGVVMAHQHVPLRHIAGEVYATEIPDEIRIGTAGVDTFEAEGGRRIAMLTAIGPAGELGQQPAILSIFDDSKVPQLLDAVDVGLDAETWLDVNNPIRIGPKDEALVSISQHFNTAERYETFALMFMRGGKLELIDQYSSIQTHHCPAMRWQEFTFSAKPLAEDGPYDGIAVSMEAVLEHKDVCPGDTPPAPYSKSASTVYKWDAKQSRFVADSDAVAKLQEAVADEF